MLCKKCNIEKDESKFSKKGSRKDGSSIHHTTCKECQSIISKNHYADNKEKYLLRNRNRKIELYTSIDKSKTLGCAICPETEPCTLDFHHINKDTKSFTISAAVRDNIITQKQLIEEINKCIVVCSNCHRKIHSGLINTERFCPGPNLKE